MDSPKRWVIYCHTHVESGRRYVGLTSRSMSYRWNQHLQNAKKKRGRGCEFFWNAIRKHGPEAFSHEVLAISWDLEGANATEEFLIEYYETRDPVRGFNLARGGTHTPHPIRKNPWDDPIFRQKQADARLRPGYQDKMSKSIRQSLSDPDVRSAISSNSKAHWDDPEHRSKHASAMEKVRNNPHHRATHAAAMDEVRSDPSYSSKMSESLREYHVSDGAKEKASLAAKLVWENPEHKKKHDEAMQKIRNDPEYKKKVSDGLKAAFARKHS